MKRLTDSLGARLALAVTVWLVSALAHRLVSDVLGQRLETPFGSIAAVHAATYAMYAAALPFAAWLLRRIAVRERAALAAAAWCLLVVAIVACHLTLVTIAVEIIHYPQYALIAVLFAYALDPLRQERLILETLLVVAALSAADEALQYLHLMSGQNYFDFNDLLLNQIGALAGLLLYYGFPRQSLAVRRPRSLLKVLVVGYCVVAVVVGVALGGGALIAAPDEAFTGSALATDGWRVYLQLEPAVHAAWRESRSGGMYYVLGAFGWLLGFLVTLLIGWLIERAARTV